MSRAVSGRVRCTRRGGAALALGLVLVGGARAADRPNLITIVTDDQGVWAMRAYGNPDAVTPNLDRLAREGARFTRAFAASGVCTPSRAALLTGMYAIQTGMPDVPYLRDPNAGLPRGVPAWPRVLERNGYATGLIGKWHLGATPEHYPTHYGLGYFFGFLGGSSRPLDAPLVRDHKTEQTSGFLADVLTDDAIGFVESNRGRPFALLLHFREPHAPHLPVSDPDLAPFAHADPRVPMVSPEQAILDNDQESASPEAIALHEKLLKQKLITYYAAVHSVDRNVGRLLKTLDRLDLAPRTIVLFTSDQGYMFGHRGLKGKGAAQPVRNHTLQNDAFVINLFDVSLQVPLLVRWPGIVRPGQVVDALVSNVDTYATVLGMLSIPPPQGASNQSRDFSPLLRGAPFRARDEVFAEYTPDQIGAMQFIRMVRTTRWKLVRRYLNPGGNELYDLEKDPDETQNLYYRNWQNRRGGEPGRDPAHPYPATVADLQRRLTAWQREIADPALELDATYRRRMDEIRARWSQPRQ
jgi:arylsulfatase A-like enzyme